MTLGFLTGAFLGAPKINAKNKTNIIINNDTHIDNDIDTDANSGGNNSDGGSIQTGNANAVGVVTNIVNTSVVKNCCGTPTPTPVVTPTPGQLTPTPTPTRPPDPTATPTPAPGGGGGNGANGGSAGGQGGAGNPGPKSPPSQGEVLGLSATDGDGKDKYLFYLVGSVCTIIGGKLLKVKKLSFA